MPKSVRTSRSRRSEHNTLNFSSDLELSTRRDSNWWANLSDRSVRRSLIRNVRLRENETATLSDGSYPCEEVNSQWWKELNENQSTILLRNEFKNRNRCNSVVEEDDKTLHESDSEDNDENVARKMIFPGRQLRSGNYRFSKAFHLEQSQTNEPEVQAETNTCDNGETNNEKNKSAETVARTGEPSKRKMKRKTVQLFSRKPYSQRFSEAFNSVEEEKIESEQQDKSNLQSQPNNEEQHSEIIVPATQVSQETPRKSQVAVVQDTLSDIEVNETLTKSKTNLETTTQKKNLFSNIQEKKRRFSEAFLKTADDETCVDTNKESDATKNVTENDTIDTELNQSVEIRTGLFGQKQTQSRKFSEAFSDDSIDKSNQELAFRKSHIKESEQTKNLDKISEDILSNEQSENISAVRKSSRISNNNDTNQMEVSENVQIKQNLFQANVRETRRFSEAFSDAELSNQQEENNIVSEHSKVTRKSTRMSKQINETNQMEMSENMQPKNLFNTMGKKKNRKFSDAFTKSRLTDDEIDRDDNLSENLERESARRDIKSSKQTSELQSVAKESDTNDENTRKSVRLSKINETKQMEISESVQSRQELFKATVKENRKFSEAFDKSTITEHEVEPYDNLPENEIIERDTIERSTRRSRQKSELLTKSIPNKIDDNIPVRGSLRLSKINETKQMEISENVQPNKDLFKAKVIETRKFSEAFDKSDNQGDNILGVNSKMSERKSTRKSENDSSHLSTLPSINDTVGNDKKLLFKPKARKSLFSPGNTPSRMKRIDENAAVESEPNPQSFPAEPIDQNVVFSDSVMSRFFETSLISSTKLIINPNLTRRNSTDDSQVEENQNENKNKTQNRRSLRGSHVPSQGTSTQTKNIARLDQESSRKKIDESEAQINKDTTQNKSSQSSTIVQQDISKHKETSGESHQKKQIDYNDEEEKNRNKPQSKTRSTNIVPQEILISAEQTEKPENASTECDAPTGVVSKMNKGVSKIPGLRTLSKKNYKSKTLETVDNQSELTTNESNVQSTIATEYEDINAVENSETRTTLKNISKRASISNEDNSQESQISHSSGKRSSKFITDDIQTHILNNKSTRVSTTAESTDKTGEEKPETRTSSHKNTSKFNLNDIEKNVTYNKSNRISVQQDTDKDTTEIQSSKKQFVSKSLQSEYGENEKSKKSVIRSENDKSKKVLRFTENYENEIVNENEERTWNNTISCTDHVSVSLQRNPTLVPIEESKLKSKDDKLQMRKELLLKALNEVNPKIPQITTQQLPSKKITDFFSKINFNAITMMTKNKVTKPKPKPIPSYMLVNGKRYKPEKLFKGAQWCNKRFYKYLQNKLEDKYGESTIVESENLMKIIASSAKIILKSKQHPADEITKLKKELARRGVISTTFDFYGLVADYLPYEIREKIVPCTRAHYATPTVPYDHEEVYKPIKF